MQEVYLIHMKWGRSKEDYSIAVTSKELFDLADNAEYGKYVELPEGWKIPEEYADYPEDYTFNEALYLESVNLKYPCILLGETEYWRN